MSKVTMAKPEGKRTVLRKALGEAGRPLPEAVRVDLEIEFSADLNGIRIHTGSLGDEIAKSLDAEAVTLGQHIFFRAGKWSPETADGMDLIVHETAHTLQHAGPVLNRVDAPISQPGDAVERSAEAVTSQGTAEKEHSAPKPMPEATAARRVAGLAPREKHTADPARTIEELGRTLLQRVRNDSQDRSGRIRNQLIRMEDVLRRDVLRWLENHMESHEWRGFVQLLAEEPPSGTEGAEDGQAREVAKEKPAAGAGIAAAQGVGEVQTGEAIRGKSERGKKENTEAAKEPGAQREARTEGKTEDKTAEGEGGQQEGDIAKPAIEADKDRDGDAATSENTAGAGAGASLPQAQTVAAPAISAPPAPAEEPAGAGAASGPAEAPTEVPRQEDEQASRTEQTTEGESAGATPSIAEPASSEVGAAAVDSTPQGEGVAADDGGRGPQEGSAAESGDTAGDALQETASSPEAGAASAVSEPDSTAADAAGGLSSQGATTPSAEEETASAGSAALSQPTPETPEPAPEPEPVETAAEASSGQAEIVSGSQKESVGGSSTPEAEATETVDPESPGTESAARAGAGTAGDATPTPTPGAIPPGLLGEFSGEPSDAEPPGAAGGGGGGGAAAAPPPPEPVADTVPAGDPAAALQTIGSMKVGPASRAMGAAAATVSAKTDQQRAELAAHPPVIERPTGSPQGAAGSTAGNVPKSPPGGAPKAVAAVAGGAPVALAPPQAAPQPGASVTQKVAPPQVTGTAQGQLSQADVQRVEDSVENIPVTDEALNVTAGQAPALPLEGDADPAQTDQQQSALMDSAATNLQDGVQEAAAPMGEDHIYPKVQPGTITPDAAGSCDCGGGQPAKAAGEGGATAAGNSDPKEMGIEAVADQESGDKVRQTANQAAGDITTDEQNQATEEATANADSQQQVTTAIEENARQQTAERTQARKEVQESRKEWTKGQQDAVDQARDDSANAVKQARGDVAEKQKGANEEAAGHIADGDKKIQDAREESEQKARAEKEKAKKEEDDGGILGWLSSKVTSFFSALRDAIHAVFDFARKLVKDAIELAQKLAHEVIDLARKAVVGLIKIAGELLASIGDVLLAAFPELRDKFRAAIEKTVDAAVDTVNKLADALDKGIKALLNGLLTALNTILCAYETLLNGIVDTVASVVKGAIAAARAIVAAFGMFAALVGDIAADPGQWLSNLADSVMDGMKNHLWAALKLAVKTWFNDMVEGIIGMGKMLLDLLRKGGLSLRKIAGFVWQAIISALPGIIIQFLIEKLIAMIIPAAGAIIAIIQGLVAAWGAIQRIIQAFQLFFIFLKAVKNGGAGPQFATALAASAIAVLQFLANFLISRLGKAASGVTSRLKALAQKLMAFFKRVGKGALKVIRKVGRVVMRGVRSAGHLAKRGIKAVGRVARRAVKAIGRVTRRVLSRTGAGRAVLRTYDKARKKVGELREKFKQRREKRKQRRKEDAAKRVDKALGEIPPILESSAHKGIRGILLPARLLIWKLKYRLRKLRLEKAGHKFNLVAAASPERTAPLSLEELPDEFLRDIVRAAVDKIMLSPAAEAAEERIAGQARAGGNIDISHPSDILGYNRHFARAGTQPLHYPDQRNVNFLLQGGGRASSFETGPSPGRMTPHPTITNQIVGEGQASYPAFSNRLGTLAASRGVSPAAIHGEFDNFVRLGIPPPGGAEQAHLFAEMQLLTTMREGIRSSGLATAETAFGSDLVRGNRITPAQLLDRTETATGYSMVPTGANPQFRRSEANRFQRTFLRGQGTFGRLADQLPENASAAQKAAARADKAETTRITNTAARSHRDFRNRVAEERWESTPLGERHARSQGREPLRPQDVHWGGSANTAERRHAALTKEWLRLKNEQWRFANLAEARTVISDLVLARLKEYYRTDDFKDPHPPEIEPDLHQKPVPVIARLPVASPQLELPLGE